MSAAALPTAAAAPSRSRGFTWANRGATVLLAAVLCLLALGLGLRGAGLTALVDYSDSMAPAIHAGDVVITRGATAADLRPGQIATLLDPASGRLITHRVTATARSGGRVVVTTRGDANSATERWALRPGAEVRTMAARIPAVGHAILWISSGGVRILLAGLGCALLAAAVLRRIWSDA